MRRQHTELEIGTSRIPVTVTRSGDRNTVAVSVHPDGEVSVKAPKGARLTRIMDRVSSRSRWILEQQEHFRQLHRGYPRQFISGESFYYMGRQYKLKVRRSRALDTTPDIRMYAGRFDVTVPNEVAPDDRADVVREQLVGWYRERAQFMLTESTARYADTLGLDTPSIHIRQMSRRWGSASSSGRVTYNWQIVMAPKRLVEYVTAHEICHLIRNDHSREFWRILERVMPDYESRRIELAIQGARFHI